MKSSDKGHSPHQAIRDRLYKLRNDVRLTSHLCYNPTCQTGKLAIKSHLLQENGILTNIAEYNGNRLEVIELKITNLNVRVKTAQPYHFKISPITKTHQFAFWGFCDTCDQALFAELEMQDSDLSTVRNQLLLVYRGLLGELSKKEYNIKFHLAIDASDFPLETKQEYKELRQTHAAGMVLLQSWKIRIEQSLFYPNLPSPFSFLYFSLPKRALAASVIFNSELFEIGVKAALLEKARPWPALEEYFVLDEALDDLGFLHIIPRADSLDVSLAYTPAIKMLAGISVEQIAGLSISAKQKLISDLLITQGETWCTSPSIYKKWQKVGHDVQILQAINYHFDYTRKFDEVKINIFD